MIHVYFFHQVSQPHGIVVAPYHAVIIRVVVVTDHIQLYVRHYVLDILPRILNVIGASLVVLLLRVERYELYGIIEFVLGHYSSGFQQSRYARCIVISSGYIQVVSVVMCADYILPVAGTVHTLQGRHHIDYLDLIDHRAVIQLEIVVNATAVFDLKGVRVDRIGEKFPDGIAAEVAETIENICGGLVLQRGRYMARSEIRQIVDRCFQVRLAHFVHNG